MIDHLRWGQCLRILDRENDALDERPAAGGTPIHASFFR